MNEPKVLLVEDEIDLAQLLRVTLNKEGLQQIFIAHTLAEGERLFQIGRAHV